MIRYMKIGEICDILNGYAFKSSRYINNKGIRVIRITNVQKGYIEDAEPKFYPEKEMNEIKKFMLEDGDLLISLTGNVGRVALIDKSILPAALNQRVGCIRVNKKDLIYKPYLYHLLNSDYFEKQCINSSNGIAQKNMSTEWLKEYHIPVYSMDYQKKIATIFDKIDIVIKKHYKQIEILDKIAKSLFIEMFGDPVENPKKWDIIQLHDRCDIVTGNTPAREKSEYYGNYIEWIKSDNINTDDMYLTVAEEYLSKKGLLVGRCVEAGSILMTCIAGSIGCIGNVGVANRKVAFNQQINAIVPNKDSNIFIYWLMVLSKKYIQGTVNMSLKGILSKGKLSELYFPFPPIELQHKFEKNAIVIDKSKLAVKKSLEELEILKKSLMQKYFA